MDTGTGRRDPRVTVSEPVGSVAGRRGSGGGKQAVFPRERGRKLVLSTHRGNVPPTSF